LGLIARRLSNVVWHIDAETLANAKAKAEMRGALVTSVTLEAPREPTRAR
jgi:hypothetical protein